MTRALFALALLILGPGAVQADLPKLDVSDRVPQPQTSEPIPRYAFVLIGVAMIMWVLLIGEWLVRRLRGRLLASHLST